MDMEKNTALTPAETERQQEKQSLFERICSLAARHKKLCLLAVVLTAGALLLGRLWPWQGKDAQTDSFTFIRTTTLRRTGLEETISASGTVESSSVSNVTTQLKYAVREVNVQVGDHVQEGGVICTLDTEQLDEQIAKAQTELAKAQEKAQDAYDAARISYETKFSAALAQDEVCRAVCAEYEAAAAEFEAAKTTVSSLQAAYDAAYVEEQAAAQQVAAALDAYTAAVTQAEGDLTDKKVTDAAQTLSKACMNYNGTAFTAGSTVDSLSKAGGAAAVAQAALDALNSAKQLCGYTQLEEQLQNTLKEKEQAESQLATLENQYITAREQMVTAAKALEDQTSEQLEELFAQREDCVLKAASSGTVTALNATVGSAVSNSTVAVIQDTEALKISFRVEEYDIPDMAVGLPVKISSDATGDAVINGRVSQVSKTADAGQTGAGGFSCEAQVTDSDTGLLIGMNAKVEVVLSSTEDVFIVPIDAVGTDENGASVVYVKTGGTGADAVFEELPVTCGAENDYYIEISGEGLSEGMEIRASANEEEAMITQQEAKETAQNGAGFGMGMLGGMTGGRPSGNMGGGMPGGQMGGRT